MTQQKLRHLLYRCRQSRYIQIGKVSTVEVPGNPDRLVFADRMTTPVYDRHFYLAYAAGKPVAIIYNMGLHRQSAKFLAQVYRR